MKISSATYQIQQQARQNQRAAQDTGASVTTTNTPSSTSNATQANIAQTLQQTLTDTISSLSQSTVRDSLGDEQTHQVLQTLQSVAQISFGQTITVRAVNTLNQDSSTGIIQAVEVTRLQAFESDSHFQIQSLGKVTTEDGREIDFLMELNYDRETQGIQTNIFRGDRNLIDPLVINLNGQAPALSDSFFEFDLNNDGIAESLHQTATGTGFIAFDKNQNGIIDNGSELFGPNSANGFNELAQYDDDGNGWIDENDSIYNQLSFMSFDENGEQTLQNIRSVEIGAIGLQSVDINHDLYDSNGSFQAQIARSGVALSESGKVLAVQEIYYEDQAASFDPFSNASPFQSLTLNISQGNPLTLFQVDNAILNQRDANAQVSFDRPRFSLNFNSSQAFNRSTTQFEFKQSSWSRDSGVSGTSKREDVQSYFQQKIASSAYVSQLEVNDGANTRAGQSVKIEAQSQSVFWEYGGVSVFQAGQEDEKVLQLKQLIESLKLIREQQVKMQEKLGIYQNISHIDVG